MSGPDKENLGPKTPEFGTARLIQAAIMGDTDRIKELLKNGVDVDAGSENYKKETALIMAAHHGQTEVVRLLIDNNADINKKNASGYNALIWAAEGGYADIVCLLVDKGANLYERTEVMGHTALSIAQSQNHVGVIEILKKAIDAQMTRVTSPALQRDIPAPKPIFPKK